MLRSEILGSLKMRSYLSGMPELKLGLNDKLLFESSGRSTAKGKVHSFAHQWNREREDLLRPANIHKHCLPLCCSFDWTKNLSLKPLFYSTPFPFVSHTHTHAWTFTLARASAHTRIANASEFSCCLSLTLQCYLKIVEWGAVHCSLYEEKKSKYDCVRAAGMA